MMLYGDQIERLIAKNDKPLSAKDAAKEDERIQKLTDKRKNETSEQRAKRLKQEEKDREETRQFVSEIADAYNFHLTAMENLEGRETYVIDAEPRPGFEPHAKGAKFLPKFRFRIWIDKAEGQWVKLDAQAIDTVSLGLFLARVHKGSRIVIEQTRVNDEVWLAAARGGERGRPPRPGEELRHRGRCHLSRLQEVPQQFPRGAARRRSPAALAATTPSKLFCLGEVVL